MCLLNNPHGKYIFLESTQEIYEFMWTFVSENLGIGHICTNTICGRNYAMGIKTGLG